MVDTPHPFDIVHRLWSDLYFLIDGDIDVEFGVTRYAFDGVVG